MTAQTPNGGEQQELLGRLYTARDLPEALSIFFDSVLGPEGVDCAIALARDGEALRGVLGMGWGPEQAGRVRLPLDDTGSLQHVYHTREAADADAPAALHRAGVTRYHAVPLFAPAADDPPFGLLLIAREGDPVEPSAELRRRIGVAGPVLARVAERDDLLQGARQLENQRDLLSAIVNALPDPVLITGEDNTIILENRRARSLFSTGDDDSSGRRRAVEMNNLLFSAFLTRSTIGGDSGVGRELNLVDPSEGGDLLFEVLATPLPPSVSKEPANVSVLRDVTDLKSASTELEDQVRRVRHAEMKSSRERDRLNLILENVGDPILVTDPESNIILMNREAEKLFEVPAGMGARSNWRRDVRTNDTKFSTFISDFALGQRRTTTTELTLTEPETSTEFPVEVVSGKVLNERGEMTAIVSILHDLTKSVENERLASELGKLNESLEDRIRAATLGLEERNRQLEWQREELERAYRVRSEFLASMSHELRTPINALLGYASLLRDQIYGDLNQRQEEALSRMYSASQHLLELVNDILDLAKIEAGKMPVYVESVDVHRVIKELSHTIEPMVRRRDLEYELDLGAENAVVRTDQKKVKQIMLNLLSNAVKFTREGTVSVSTRQSEKGGIVIDVADTGIGIRSEDLTNIFDDFRQVDQSSTREFGGTGLGLSITKKLLHILGGTIHVDSEVGSGTTFTVWLPNESEEIVLNEEVAKLAREAGQAVVE